MAHRPVAAATSPPSSATDGLGDQAERNQGQHHLDALRVGNHLTGSSRSQAALLIMAPMG